jgi:hypothetical protein
MAAFTPADEFKLMEKRIKTYTKDVDMEKRKLSQRQRMLLTKERAACEHGFDWTEVVDVYNTDVFKRPCNSPADTLEAVDPDQASPTAVVHDLSPISSGLYLIEGALSPRQQLHWAKRAVEDYSTVKHNNLTNLHNLSDSDGPMHTTPMHSEQADRFHVHAPMDLWRTSVREAVPYRSFSDLRWSCLGYHYSKRSG